jgi:hypothetical protein
VTFGTPLAVVALGPYHAGVSDEATMSGALVMEHRRILTQLCSPEGFAEVVAELPPAEREAYLAVDPLVWFPVATAEKVFDIAARRLERQPAELHESVSRVAVENTLTKLWRFVLRFVPDDALIARSERLYARAFQRGKLDARFVKPGRVEIHVDGWPDMPEFSIRGFRIAIETVLRLTGREDAQLTLHRTPNGPRLLATWKPRA